MDEESAAFDKFIQEQTMKTRQEMGKKCKNTKGLMLNELPLNTGILEKNGMPRHGHCNLYENYEDRIKWTSGKEHLTEEDMQQEVYKIRRIQGYLGTGQAGQLEQLTV